jgi:hypothetical protein
MASRGKGVGMSCTCGCRGPDRSCLVGCSLWESVENWYTRLTAPDFVQCSVEYRDEVIAEYERARRRYMRHVWPTYMTGGAC